jgi:SH3 domain-containing YSC84-like protein 1
MKFGRMSVIAVVVALLFTAGMVAATTVQAATRSDAQVVVDKAKLTFNDFMHDKKFTWFHDHLKDAKGLLIFPEVLKAGYIVGGSGGTGVLVVKDEKTCNWTDPAFYTIGSASIGLQIGAQSAEVIVMVMNQHAVDALLASSVKFGAGASFAVGPVGEGAKSNVMADFISFSKAKGIYAGVSLAGSVVDVRDSLNSAYYGREVRPADIIVKRDVSNKGAADFLAVVKMSTMGTEGRCAS